MRSVTYSMSVSLDIVGPYGTFDWTMPDEVFRFWIDEIPFFPPPSGSRTRREPHLQLESRLSPLPR